MSGVPSSNVGPSAARGVRLPVVYPLWNIPIALIGTLALALGMLLSPVRRAVRLRPGEALRHA